MSFDQVDLGQLITPATLHRAGKGTFPVLPMTMRDGLVDQADKFKKRVASVDTSQYKVVRKNQLVVGFPIDEGVLSFQNLYEQAIVSPAYDVWDIRNEELVESRYLERFLRSPHALVFYASKLRGTTARRRTLPDDIFLSLPVPLPSLVDQRRIANVLERAEGLRCKRRAALAQLDTVTQSIFLDLFGDPTTNSRRVRSARLSDVTRRITDGTHLTPAFVKHGVPFIFVKNVKNGAIDFQTDKFISEDEHRTLYKRCPIEQGDVLYTIVGATYGQAAAVGCFTKFAFQRHIAHLKPDAGKILPAFLGTVMQFPFVKKQADRWARGAAQPTINLKELRNFEIPLPALVLQCEFTHKVSSVERLKAAHRASLDRLDSLFTVLLYRAFRGEL